MASKSITLCPTYNEAQNIGIFLERFLRVHDTLEVLFIDNNSPDGTAKIIREWQEKNPRIHLLSRAGKSGLASAYKAGFQWALDHGYDRMIQMDVDLSHEPESLPDFLKALDHSDFVVGSRYCAGGKISGWSFIRKFISWGGNVYARILLRIPIRDATGGFNGWSRSILGKIKLDQVKSQGYTFQIELKHLALKAGGSFKEIPIHFPNRIYGQSKMTGKIVWEAAGRVLKMAFCS